MYEVIDVETYCQELSLSDVLSCRLIGWTGRWSLFGSFVLCCQCLSSQAVDDAGQPFKHLRSCSASGMYPWEELKEVAAAVAGPCSVDRIAS